MKCFNKQDVYRFVKGGLIQCIDAHGPINLSWIDSAAKRIVTQIEEDVTNWAQSLESAQVISNLRKEITQLKVENNLLRDRLNKKRIFEHKKPVKNNLRIGLEHFE